MKRKLLKIATLIAAFTLIIIVGVILLYLGVLYGVFGRLPDREQLQSITNEEASLIYSSDKVLIGKVFAENRTEVKEVPAHLKQALISTEDKRFYEHKGYDTRSYFRVLVKSILLGDRSAGGGSTIEQQLAKNLYGRPYHGFLSMPVNKIREAIVASRMEDIYNKEDILLLYLNSVPFGENTYGVEAASFRYFNKTAGELSVEQSALLVGLLKANTAYNPRLNPERAMARRNTVLSLMADEDFITEEEADSLANLPLGLDYTNYELDNPAGYFAYQIKKEAAGILEMVHKPDGSPFDIEKDGLRIITTLDFRLQTMALDAIQRQLSQKQKLLDRELAASGARQRWERQLAEDLDRTLSDSLMFRPVFSWNGTGGEMTVTDSLWHYHRMLHAALLMMEPGSGKIRVWVGGNHFRYLPYDLVQARRQTASSFKPFIYASALEQGFEPCDYLPNEWEENENYPGWQPKNYDGTSGGKIPMWFALSRSLNIPSVNLYMMLDKEELQMQCQLFGLKIPEEEQPSVALGAEAYSLFDMVQAYSAFASYGSIPWPVMVEAIFDREGNQIYQCPDAGSKKAVNEAVAGTINKILVNAVKEGTGIALKSTYGVSSVIAGKTGTSQDYSDAWFFAYTEEMVCGVWVGAMSPTVHFRSGANGSGSRLALPIAGMMLNEMESDPELSKKYLTGFNPAVIDSAYFDCDTVRDSSKFKEFFQDLFKKDKEKEQVKDEEKGKEKIDEKDKKEGKFKSFFKRIFGKKKGKDGDKDD